jgi:hypothetical protein
MRVLRALLVALLGAVAGSAVGVGLAYALVGVARTSYDWGGALTAMRIAEPGFTGAITRHRASGTLEDETPCEGRRLEWTARRTVTPESP